MRSWRLFKTIHSPTALTGLGAKLAGGRWNSPGRPVIYTAATLSLAALEILVNIPDYTLLRESYSCCDLAFPEDCVEMVSVEKLPEDWRRPLHPGLKEIGDAWLREGLSAVLEVPSAVVPMEMNYLLNPEHPKFGQVAFGQMARFSFDERLVTR